MLRLYLAISPLDDDDDLPSNHHPTLTGMPIHPKASAWILVHVLGRAALLSRRISTPVKSEHLNIIQQYHSLHQSTYYYHSSIPQSLPPKSRCSSPPFSLSPLPPPPLLSRSARFPFALRALLSAAQPTSSTLSPLTARPVSKLNTSYQHHVCNGTNMFPAPTAPTAINEFIDICAEQGQQAKCCILPILGQALLCADVNPTAPADPAALAAAASAA
jgi:hypothetical protein